jgi:hypothetical protein
MRSTAKMWRLCSAPWSSSTGKLEPLNGLKKKKVIALTLVIPWENTGVTPAMNGTSRVNWVVIPNDLPDNSN